VQVKRERNRERRKKKGGVASDLSLLGQEILFPSSFPSFFFSAYLQQPKGKRKKNLVYLGLHSHVCV